MYDCFGYLCRRKAVRRINSLLILWAHFTTRKAGAAGGRGEACEVSRTVWLQG